MATDDDAREHAYREGADYLADRAAGLFASVQDGTPTAVEWLRRWDAPPTLEGARMALARAHGFPSWAAMESPAAPVVDPDDPFVRAFHAIENRRPDVLGELITASPGLVAVRGTNGNHLLGIATAQGDPRAVGLLLAAGADPGLGNVHGWAPLHQAAYMGRPDLAGMLLAAGAPPADSARGAGGTPLVMALFWGHPVPPALVDELGLAPGNLRVAAGLGMTDLIADLHGTPAAGAGRGFYRPHGGFPAWRPSDDPAEVRDEAVAWAARSDQPEAIEALVALGADPARDVYRGTPLAWAAASGHLGALRRLLDLGVDPSGPTTFGGPDHGEGCTPLHLAASDGETAVIAALLEAGADPTARDGRHGGTPADWARHAHQADAEAMLS
ncbi:MAG: ankyrin repeat domain-containing protein [Thermoleophilia bacterium]